jgi:creatinine amidohydrolase
VRLDHSTWEEVEAYLEGSGGIILPTGSTEQHGPIGLIGTDAICAEQIAENAGDIASALVAPTLAYTPAPFNMDFPGTISISESLFQRLVFEIVEGLISQGFIYIYFLNGHGANLDPLLRVSDKTEAARIRIKSWWEFNEVNRLRQNYYGSWEGMHATPSEIAITQATHRIIDSEVAEAPPEKLSAKFMREHAGDRHGPAKQHRTRFPDGRVGSHSALARPEHGKKLLAAAANAVAADFVSFSAI